MGMKPGDEYFVEELRFGENVPEKPRRVLAAYTREEYSNWLQDIQERRRISYHPGDLKQDLADHAPDFGIDPEDEEAFLDKAQEIIRTADEFYARTWRGTEVQLIFWKQTDFVVVDRSLRVRLCMRETHPEALKNMKARRLWLKTKGKS